MRNLFKYKKLKIFRIEQLLKNYKILACVPACQYGRCIKDQYNNNICSCLPGYTGVSCSVDIRECNSNPCKNNGICSEPFLNMYLCSCHSGFTGPFCDQIISTCDSKPCLNGGICSQTLPNSFTCICPNGFTGQQSELLPKLFIHYKL